jgi:hypothetical protein
MKNSLAIGRSDVQVEAFGFSKICSTIMIQQAQKPRRRRWKGGIRVGVPQNTAQDNFVQPDPRRRNLPRQVAELQNLKYLQASSM